MTFAFPKAVRLRTRRHYQVFGRHTSRFLGASIVIEYLPNKMLVTRLGVTVSKHYGSAVQRNFFKRIVRESFRFCRHQLPLGFDLNVKPRNGGTPISKVSALEEFSKAALTMK